MTLQVILAYSLTILGGISGALMSVKTAKSQYWWVQYLNGALLTTSWLWVIHVAKTPILITSVIWDVFYTGTFTLVLFMVAGHEVDRVQSVGVLIVLVGLFLLGK